MRTTGRWLSIPNLFSAVAYLEGETERAQDYHLRARNALVAFRGNNIQNLNFRPEFFESFEELLTLIVAAAKGNVRAQEKVEIFLHDSETNAEDTEEAQRFAAALRSILAGERDWSRLTEGLDLTNALEVVEVLSALAQSTNAWLFKAQDGAIKHEQLLANMAAALKGDVQVVNDPKCEQLLPSNMSTCQES